MGAFRSQRAQGVHASQLDVGRHTRRRGSALRRASSLVLIGCLFAAAIVASPSPAAEPFAALGLTKPGRGRVAPDFTLRTAATQTIRLSDYRGQVVLLNFWATWCPPCRIEMPAIERLYGRFKDRGFVALAVSVDTAGEETVASFATEQGLTFPIVLDAKMTVAARYGVRGLPSTFLLDRRGRIRASVVGPREWDSLDAFAVIETFLDTTGDAPRGTATGRSLKPQPLRRTARP